MKHTFSLIVITCFWIVMTSLLIQKEFFQVAAIQSQYDILPLDLEIREEYSAILMGKERIGFNFTTLEAKKDNPKNPYELRHQTYLSFLFLGHEREMLVRGKAQLDRSLKLQEFDFKISSENYWTRMAGKISGDSMDLSVESNEGEPRQQKIPLKGPLYFSEGLRFMWTPENLKIGKKGSLDVWNPLLGSFQTIRFQVKEKTTIDFENKPTEAYVIQINTGGIETKTWVNLQGEVLREDGITGIVSLKEEGWQIFDAMRKKKAKLPDLPSFFSIPANQTLENPGSLHFLKINLKREKEENVLSLSKPDLKDLAALTLPLSLPPGEFDKDLETNQWLQSTDPAIVQKAKEIAGNEKDSLKAALKILNWVHETVSPVPSMSLPQAKMVLSVKKGDCNEYTVLFTSLMRALGIPTKMIAGLVYQNGRFFYHAWSEVYLGKWIAMDPTFAQAPADVTHIPLSEGNLEEQVGLIKELGKIKIFILDSK